MSDITRVENNQRMSRVVIHNGTVWVAGTTAPDSTADISGQSRQIFERIDYLLEQAGTNKKRVLSAVIWLSNIDRDFDLMNNEWDRWIEGEGPARATVQAKLARPGLLIEVMVTAAL